MGRVIWGKAGGTTGCWYPLVFAPVTKETAWGGWRLWQRLNRCPRAAKTGEFWEISAFPGMVTKVDVGPLRGIGLDYLAAVDPEGLLGRGKAGLEFPLLVKLIAAEESLSVQVHPDDRTACALGGRGKEEAWYVLHAEPGSRIVCGVKPGTNRRRLAAALERGELPACLRQLPVTTGDFVPIPAGCIHSLGAGVLVLEIQQSADTTYRLYDWGRVDDRGLPRALHIEEGLAAAKLSCRPVVLRPWQQRKLLYHGVHFRITKRRINGRQQQAQDPAAFRIWSVVQGRLLVTAASARLTLERGASLLIPAGVGWWRAEGEAVILETGLADRG